MKIRLVQAGYTTFTGELGHINFVDGVSVDSVNTDFARSLSGIVQTEVVEEVVAAPIPTPVPTPAPTPAPTSVPTV